MSAQFQINYSCKAPKVCSLKLNKYKFIMKQNVNKLYETKILVASCEILI